MKILVIGSGLIGLSTAYFLKDHGHDVTVLDRGTGPGRETSYANGALLTPSMAEPWNAPGSWLLLLKSLGRSDSAMQLRLGYLPKLVGWGLSFLVNSRPATFKRNARSNLRLSLYSREALKGLRDRHKLEYGRKASGSLRIFRDRESLKAAIGSAQEGAGDELDFKILSGAEAAALEPALSSIEGDLAGGIYFPADEVGDAYTYCNALAELARERGVEFRFGAEVTSLKLVNGRVAMALSRNGHYTADHYIVACGSYSAALLRTAGISVPVQPVKGYSVTVDVPAAAQAPAIPIVDDARHTAIVPVNGKIRVVGTAEFSGFDLRLAPERVQNLVEFLKGVLPHFEFEPDAVQPWCGLRPMSSDGVPLIGATAIPNLHVNTGHGHLGWTMAAGSGRLLADLVSQETPSLDPAPYSPARFHH